MSEDPSWRTILTRCASPPDRVPAGRSRDRYPSPISTKESRLSRSAASSGATGGASSPRTQPARSLICIAQASAMLAPLIFDDLANSVSRVPPHSGQAVNVTARSTNARMCGCIPSVSFDSIDLWIRGTRPS